MLIFVMKNIQNIHQPDEWIISREKQGVPFCSSVDIRDAGFKVAVVDTNLFPAGFNNLCEESLTKASLVLRKILLSKGNESRTVLIVAEAHTRNLWYLENVFSLRSIVLQAGYDVKIVAPLDQNDFENFQGFPVKLQTALGNTLEVGSLSEAVKRQKKGDLNVGFVIMNNDLMQGVPEELLNWRVPIYPSPISGWHFRRKSRHFDEMNKVVSDFFTKDKKDPWLYSCLHRVCRNVDIHNEKDRLRMSMEAENLLGSIQKKYQEYGVTQKPFLFIKADYGTYGMGVHAFEDAKEITQINRKTRNFLHKGKSSKVVNQFLLQEGVPSSVKVKDKCSEVCVYQMNNEYIGSFYRVNGNKNDRQNLNSKGMFFQKMCTSDQINLNSRCANDCSSDEKNSKLELYKKLARLSGIAAHQEVEEMKLRWA
ncbi:glutamate--cysteine ligase [PVC group bacterium (ex Bugula neritina AB1)]|nr:glutamate--cysteine ligase [PVC group bacterium (ex Bugula neritina AB1)]